MQGWFHDVVGYLTDILEAGQIFNCRMIGEDSDAVRFNGGKIRQAGRITQRRIGLQLIRDDRQVAGALDLSGDITSDRFQLRRLHGQLSTALEQVPPDPHLVFPSSVESTEDREVPLSPGLYVEAEIAGRRSSGVFVLPRTAWYEGEHLLIVDREGRVSMRTPVIERLERETIVVSGGVSAGERVIVTPLEIAVDGMRVVVGTGETP